MGSYSLKGIQIIMMNLRSSEHPMLGKESTLPMVKLTSNKPYCDVKYDLQKLMMLSPLLKSIIGELNIPTRLSYLLDVTIIMPGVEVEALVLLVKMLRGEAANVSIEKKRHILEAANALGIELDLETYKKSKSADIIENEDIKGELNDNPDKTVNTLLDTSDNVENEELSLTFDNDKSYHENPDQKMFVCNECDATCSSAKLLRRHLNKHTGILRTACDVCEKIFNRKD